MRPLVALAFAVVLLGGCSASTPSAPSAVPTSAVTPTTTVITGLPGFDPIPEDFEVDITIANEECSGSDGCTVTFKADVTYVGIETVPKTGTVEVTYQLKGVEDVYTSTIEVEDGSYTPDVDVVSTKQAKATVTAEVTKVVYAP